MLGMFKIWEIPLSTAKPRLRRWQQERTEPGFSINNEGEGDSRMRKLQVDGLDFLHKVKVKVRSKREVEVGGRDKM